MNKILVISHFTFKEALKSKILINVAILGIALALITYVATEFTFGVPARVALNFGLGSLSLSANAIAIFLGVGLISKEIDSRTIYMIVSRPVSRSQFLLGKLLGLKIFLMANVLLLALITLVSSSLLGGKLTSLVLMSVFFVFVESVVLMLLVVFLSLWVNTAITVIFAILSLFLGHGVAEVMNVTFVQNSEVFQALLKGYQFILPAFYKFNLKELAVYQNDVPLNYYLSSFTYAAFYGLALLCFSIVSLNKKSLD